MALVSQYLFLYAVCVLGIYAEMDSGFGIGVYVAIQTMHKFFFLSFVLKQSLYGAL